MSFRDLKFKLNPYFSPVKQQELVVKIEELNGTLSEALTETTIFITDTMFYPQELFPTLMATTTFIDQSYFHKVKYNIEHYSPDKKMIFSGFKVHSTINSENEIIYGGVEAFGGQYTLEYSPDITHLITHNFDDLAKKSIAAGIKVITPEYFDDCFKLQQKCSDEHYIFPNPNIYSSDIFNLLGVKQKRLKSITKADDPRFLAPFLIYIDPILYPDQLFSASTSDNVPPPTSQEQPRWIKNIISFGGRLTIDIDQSNLVITDIQSTIYQKAKELNIKTVTRRHMRDQIKHETFLDNSSLLYYPRPIVAIPTVENMIVSITNYSGKAREDIIMMAQHLGMKFTRSMSAENTHLICAMPIGDKYDRALLWDLHIVNHFWIEDCYKKWGYQREAKPRYLVFTAGIEDTVNSTLVSDIYNNSNNSMALLKVDSSLASINVDETFAIVDDPNAPIESMQEKQRLNQQTIDVISSVQKTITDLEPEIRILQEHIENHPRTAQKRKLSSPSQPKKKKSPALKILFTGIRPLQKQAQALKDLGIKITDTTKDFDLLISRGIFRTEKFLVALSTNVPILSGDWITDTIAKKLPQDPSKYLLQDKSQEKVYNFKLDQSRKNSEHCKLLKGITVYITENVTPGIAVFKNLVEASGGDACVLLNKKNQRRIKGKISNSGDNLIISNSLDQDVYVGFKELGFKVYSAEFMLTGLLLQKLDYDNVKNCY